MPEFENVHETSIRSRPADVHALVNDLRQWQRWSPWEDKDPDLDRSYTGSESGFGAEYSWTGNKQVGAGRMQITGSTPERIDIDLEFIKPVKARNRSVFAFKPEGDGTHVSWTMTGRRNLLMHLAGRLFVDKALAKDFDRGLAKLKAAAESGADV